MLRGPGLGLLSTVGTDHMVEMELLGHRQEATSRMGSEDALIPLHGTGKCKPELLDVRRLTVSVCFLGGQSE